MGRNYLAGPAGDAANAVLAAAGYNFRRLLEWLRLLLCLLLAAIHAAPDEQILVIAELMMGVLANPPKEGQHIGEWAKQQACRKKALDTTVPVAKGFEALTARRPG